ncbi:MAG: family 16 glycosylhydrolase [Spirochaetaceae bacterium]|nr:family 16 glycosylhydrolase [Spirochaetaceae bacterium]
MKKVPLYLILVLSGTLTTPLFPQGGGKTVINSGRATTMGKFSFQYGILEVSVKIPKTADGLWPALRLLGSGYAENSWPGCGEIDLLEMGHSRGIEGKTQNKFFYAGAHWGALGEDGSHPQYEVYRTNLYGLQYGDFHLITLVWDEGSIKMYLDRDKAPSQGQDPRPSPAAGGPIIGADMKPYFEMDITPGLRPYFCKPFFIALDLAAGGSFTKVFTVDGVSALNRGNLNQASMYIDYIRVYNAAGTLIFDEEFNFPRIDTQKWNIEESPGGGRNQGLQNYRRRNVQIDKDRASGRSCLIITARKEAGS